MEKIVEDKVYVTQTFSNKDKYVTMINKLIIK